MKEKRVLNYFKVPLKNFVESMRRNERIFLKKRRGVNQTHVEMLVKKRMVKQWKRKEQKLVKKKNHNNSE